VCRVDRRVSRRCDELTVLFDLALVAFKSFAVVSDFDIAYTAITCHVVRVCAVSRFFQVSTLNPNNQTELHGTACVLLYARLP